MTRWGAPVVKLGFAFSEIPKVLKVPTVFAAMPKVMYMKVWRFIQFPRA